MKFYVTTPIFYINAKPHIGHVYTTIAADVLARWHRSKQDDVLFSTGTDENSQKNVEAAKTANQDIAVFVDDMADTWENTFKELGISHDFFVRTTSPEHHQAVTALLNLIETHGDIYLGDYQGLYCEGSEDFVNESDLVNGLCPNSNKPPKKITEQNYFFKLSNYRDRLLEHYQKNPDFVQPESARKEIISYIEHELADISISRQAQEWGIRLPQDSEHAVYVWFDALINYLTVAGFPADEAKFKRYWPADVHLIGKDIIKFHGAIWPAMLMAADLPLPKKVFAHGFFTIDGQKISKSLGNAIDPIALAKEYPFDAIRYYLLRDIPFGNDGDFSPQRLLDRYNADLANGLGNLVSRTLNMIEQYWPDYDGSGDTPAQVEELLATVDPQLNQLAFDKALSAIWQSLTWADERIEQTKPWELAKAGDTKALQDVLAQLFLTLVAANEKLGPIMPKTHVKLEQLLNDRPIKKPTEPLFARKK